MTVGWWSFLRWRAVGVVVEGGEKEKKRREKVMAVMSDMQVMRLRRRVGLF